MGPDAKRLPKSVIVSFIKKCQIKLRRVQRNKKVDKSALVPKLMQWHCALREGLMKSGSNKESYDVKWRRFKPEQRLNVDQVPLPFTIDRKTTGLEKRQCTLQLAFSPASANIRPGLIFRGSGKRISQDEVLAHHKSVDLFWQEKSLGRYKRMR